MKYSEFEKRITERLGFKIDKRKYVITIVTNGLVVGMVSLTNRYNFSVCGDKDVTEDESRYLAQICYELACTPLEEREEEKKYRIRHKYISGMTEYINYYKKGDTFFFGSDSDGVAVRTIFTKSHLEELMHDDFYKTLLDSDIYEWEEVE